MIALRAELEEFAEADGTILLANAKTVLATEDVPAVAIDVFLKQMATMTKTACQISKVMDSIRPALPAERYRAVAALFDSISVDGFVQMGSWCDKIADGAVKAMIAGDLGSDPKIVCGK